MFLETFLFAKLYSQQKGRRKKLALLSSSSTPYNKLTDPNGIPTRQIALVRQTIGNQNTIRTKKLEKPFCSIHHK